MYYNIKTVWKLGNSFGQACETKGWCGVAAAALTDCQGEEARVQDLKTWTRFKKKLNVIKTRSRNLIFELTSHRLQRRNPN